MAERRVKVSFSAEIQGFKRAMEEAAQSTQKVKKATEDTSKAADTYLGRMVESANKSRDAWETAGASLLGIGTAAVAGLGLAGKAAMDWESAWAGVTKTVDATPEQMNELEGSLRNLAKTLPATHEEIAGVAEAAGQLGVKREDVAGFTKTMIDLSETTNLTADEAATSIAQISNVMGTMAREGSGGVERFGATLVALGNAGASTEAEILDMAKRIAGAGKLVGASESDVLALANAMASLGIESQLGGGVISRVMQRMYTDVKGGGEGLTNLAKVAGVSGKEFAAAFESDPVRAVDMVVKGLGRIKDEGGNVVQTMDDLGIKGTEETGVLLRLAGAGDILTESLKLGDAAWASNSALAEEAAKRYETTEAKVQIAWNNIKDAAIDAGAVLLPIVAGISEGAVGVAQAFGALPDPVKGALSVLGGVAGVAALGAGAFLTLTPKILDSMQAFDKLAPAGGKARGVLAGVGKAAGIATVALVGFEAIKGLHNSMQAPTASLEKFTQALVGIDKEKGSLDGLFADVGAKEFEGEINNAGDALHKLLGMEGGIAGFNTAIESFGASIGVDNGIAKLADGVTKADQALATAASSGNMDLAAKGFKSIAESADAKGVSLDKVAEKFPEYLDSLRKMATDSKVALTEQELLDWAMGKVPEKMEAAAASSDKAAEAIKGTGEASAGAAPLNEEQIEALADMGLAADGTVDSLTKLLDAMFATGIATMSARDAEAAYQEQLDTLKGKIDEVKASQSEGNLVWDATKNSFDLTTDAGQAANEVFGGLEQSARNTTKAMADAGASQPELQAKLGDTYKSLYDTAIAFGASETKADDLARAALGIPEDVPIETAIQNYADSMAKLQGVSDKADAVNGKVANVYINTHESITKYLTEKGAADLNAAQNGGATGGRVDDLMGFAGGGIVPGRPPTRRGIDNVLALVNGKPLKVRSGEWIINDASSKEYDRELAAINAGTFPKMPGYANGGQVREFSAQQLGYAPYRSDGSTSRGTTFGDVHISQQSDPVATFHEFSRRTQALAT